jgi:hypothetical protein
MLPVLFLIIHSTANVSQIRTAIKETGMVAKRKDSRNQIVPGWGSADGSRGGMRIGTAKSAARTAALLDELPHVPVGLPHVEEALFHGVLLNEVFVNSFPGPAARQR